MKKTIFTFLASLVPMVTMAQSNGPLTEGTNKITDINDLTSKVADIGSVVVYLLIALAVVYIVWNVVQYMVKPSSETKTESLKNVGWGILGLFIIVSIWGLVNLLTNTFATDNNVPTDRFPNVDFVSTSE